MKHTPMVSLPLVLATLAAGSVGPAFAGGPNAPPRGGPSYVDGRGPNGWRAAGGQGAPAGRPMPGPLWLAARLNAVETAIGIDAGQLELWRRFTNAALDVAIAIAVAAPPRLGTDRGPPPADTLEQAARIAHHLAELGKQAEKLDAATAALRGSLREDQLARLAQVGPLLPPGPSFDGAPEAPSSFDSRSFGPQGPGAPGSGHIPPP